MEASPTEWRISTDSDNTYDSATESNVGPIHAVPEITQTGCATPPSRAGWGIAVKAGLDLSTLSQ